MSYGATLVSLKMPGKDRSVEDIILGFDSFDEYLTPQPYVGATIGRVAGRIAKAEFALGTRHYHLEKNDGSHHLHGGRRGFDKYIWTPEIYGDGTEAGVIFRRRSLDGEEGYPGRLDVEVTYALNERNELSIRYAAETSKPTPVNITNHIYWNLAGKGSILNHKLRMNATEYLPVDEHSIPLGEVLHVENTPMDFSRARLIGKDIKLVPGGYDHCYLLSEAETRLRPGAILNHPESGRTLELYTTKPGLQLYSGNHLRDLPGRNGASYGKHAGVCLEPVYYPDTLHQPDFPSIILRPKEEYRHETVIRLSLR